MKTISEYNLPTFRPGQVLKHSDLNNMVNYLDKQDRLTRVYLLGIGILEGLKCSFNADASRLMIEAGAGVSSDGYFIQLESNWELVKYYVSRITVAEVIGGSNPANETDVFHLLREEESPDPLPGSGDTLADVEIKPLSDLPQDVLETHVLVIYLKEKHSNFNRCFSDVEEATGSNFSLKALLIAKDSYTLCRDDQGGAGDQTVPAPDKFEPPYIRRFGYDPSAGKIDFQKIGSFDDFFSNYLALCEAAAPVIANAYKDAYDTYREVLDQPSSNNPFSNLYLEPSGAGNPARKGKLQILFDFFSSAPNESWERMGIQYFYDYLRDLIAAYNEFVECAEGLSLNGQLVKNGGKHPRHLAMGVVEPADGEMKFSPEKCRSNLLTSVFRRENSEKYRNAQFLLDRMVKLVDIDFGENGNISGLAKSAARPKIGFLSVKNITSNLIAHQTGPYIKLPVPNLPEYKKTTLTPSHLSSKRLSKRAVPYYIHKNIQPSWNFYLNETGRNIAVMGYHYSPAQPPFDKPLHYDLESFTFFRLEGHIGKKLDLVVKELDLLRKDLDLPFDIQYVKLSKDLSGALGDVKLLADDLQMFYQATREEIMCELLDKPEADALKKTLPAELLKFDYRNFDRELSRLTSALPGPFRGEREVPVSPYSCVLSRKGILKSLKDDWTTRMEQFHVFSSYAGIHQGLEHTAGVPKGGALVVVYAQMSAGSGTLPMLTGNELIVVGDFSLDYNCCSYRGGAVLPETYLALMPGVFCSDDSKGYELVTYPLGGVLTCEPEGEFLKQDELSGKFFFYPDQIPATFFEENGKMEFQLSYSKFGHTSKTKITVYQKPVFDFPNPTQSVTIPSDGQPVSQRVTFQIAGLQPADAELTWLISGEPSPPSNGGMELTYDFPYSEGHIYEVKIIAKNGVCQTEQTKEFRICTESIELSLPEGNELELGAGGSLAVLAAPQKGIFRLLDPDGRPLRALVNPVQGGDPNAYTLSGENLNKTGVYEFIYSLPYCLKEKRIALNLKLPPVYLEKDRFCSNDDTEYPITLAAGVVSLAPDTPGVLVQNGMSFFNPTRIPSGIFGADGVAKVNLSYQLPNRGTVNKELTVYLVPEIEMLAMRPLYSRGEVMGQKACLLEGFQFEFGVKPRIWPGYVWKILDSDAAGQKTGPTVSYDFLFREGREFRLHLTALNEPAVNDGNCPLDTVEIIRIPCPDTGIDFNLTLAAQNRSLILPSVDKDPTFAIGGLPLEIKANPVGGAFQLYSLVEGAEVEIPAGSAAPKLVISQPEACEEEKIIYHLGVENNQMAPGKYRLRYWIRDCIDEKNSKAGMSFTDFNMAIREQQPSNPLIMRGAPEPSALPAVLVNRLKAYRSIVEELREDANIPRSNAFKFAEDLMKTANDPGSLITLIELAAPAAAKKSLDSSGQLKEKYAQLLDAVVFYFLDRLVAFNPVEVSENNLTLVRKMFDVLSGDGIDQKSLANRWNAEELKRALGEQAAAVGQIQGVLSTN